MLNVLLFSLEAMLLNNKGIRLINRKTGGLHPQRYIPVIIQNAGFEAF